MAPAIFPVNQFWEESTRQVWDGLGYGKDMERHMFSKGFTLVSFAAGWAL